MTYVERKQLYSTLLAHDLSRSHTFKAIAASNLDLDLNPISTVDDLAALSSWCLLIQSLIIFNNMLNEEVKRQSSQHSSTII